LQSEVEDPVIQDVAVDLKGSVFTLPVLQIHSSDVAAIEAELVERLSPALKFFKHAPIVIDLERVSHLEIDFHALTNLLSKQNLVSVGVRNGSKQQQAMAIAVGLAVVKGGPLQNVLGESPNRQALDNERETQTPSESRLETKQNGSSTTAASKVEAESPRVRDGQNDTQQLSQNKSTKIIYQPVRSGQQVYAKGGDLIVMAAVNPGAEIVADGNIHVYAPMKGRALAGVMGDQTARIFCQSMHAELIAIAGNFRVFEDNLPAEIRDKSVQAYLDGEQLIVSQL